MPQRIPVPLLLTTSMHVTASTIVNGLAVASTQSRDSVGDGCMLHVIRNYISILPVSLKETLLHYILDIVQFNDPVGYGALSCILCPYMKTLNVGMLFSPSYFARVSRVIYCQGTTLISLDLKGICLNDELSSELHNILRSLQNLRELHIPSMATDAILETIGQHNTALQILDITGDCNISKSGVESLGSVHNLQFVLLGNPRDEVSPIIVSLLIKYLPKLKSLGSYPNVGQAIECLAKENRGITTKLIHLEDSYTDLNRILLLVQTAPMLESIFIDNPSDNVISQLSLFPNLTNIIIRKFHLSELFTFTNTVGRRLSTLELMLGSGILDFGLLSKQCPNLEKLICYKVDCIANFDQIECPKLQNIGVYFSDISQSCVKDIITVSPNIENISFEVPLELNDNDILEIFSAKEFTKLKHVWFSDADSLTSCSIQILTHRCPNLISLGELSGWNLTEIEVNGLREEFKAANVALKLIDYFND